MKTAGAAVRIFGRRRGREAAPVLAPQEIVARSGLFDPAYYLATNPDVAGAGLQPIDHFCAWGWREGRRPNLYFDPAWYRETHGASMPEGENPLLHYIRRGEAEALRPRADFDPAWYSGVMDLPMAEPALAHFLAHRRAQGLSSDEESDLAFYSDRGVIAASGLFDVSFYFIGNPDVREAGRDPIYHFHVAGWREGRRPNLYFDPSWYRARHLAGTPDVDPLLHYATRGEAEGCAPVCYFDPAWYRATYRVPDGTLALAHFLAHRRSQTFAPNALFDPAFYLARYGAEIGPNRDPFTHLLRYGATRDLDPSPTFDSAAYRRARMVELSSAADPMDARGIPLVHHLDILSRAARERIATALER